MTVQTLTITSTADDCYYNTSNAALDTGGITVGLQFKGGVRFAGVAIPQGAQITSASLRLTEWAAGGSSGTAWGKWYGDAVDSAAAWSATSNPSSISKTTAFCTVAGTAGSGLVFNQDATAIVQEIVNRAGWVSGNALRLGSDTTGSNGAIVFKDVTNFPAEPSLLIVSFVSPASGGSTGRGAALRSRWLRKAGGQGNVSLLVSNARSLVRLPAAANWALDRMIYRGRKALAAAYLGTRSEGQMHLGERDLF